MRFNEILQKAREKQGFTSNDELWDALKLSKTQFYAMRKGDAPLQEEQQEILSELTGFGVPQIVAVWESEFAKSPRIREAWRNFSHVASVVAFSLAVSLATALPSLGGTSVYLLCKIVLVGRSGRLTPIKTLA